MPGQGSPRPPNCRLHACRVFRRALLLICTLAVVVGADHKANAAPLDLTIQIVWGDGAKRQWRGRISIDQGSFSDLRLLGMSADSPGSILTLGRIAGRQILVQQPSPRTYDGMQLAVRGQPESELRVELLASDEIKSKSVTVSLNKLVNSFESLDLDDSGNRLVIKRIPSDRLRINFAPRSLVFSPGEKWLVSIMPNLVSIPEKKNAECRISLSNAKTGVSPWSNTLEIEIGTRGEALPISDVEIPLPDREGVYNLEATVVSSGRRFPFRKEDVIVKRLVQLVVIARERPSVETPESRFEVIKFDPAQPRWWERLTLLPQLSLVPGFRQDGPLGDHKPERWTHRGRVWTRLQALGWQAYPLPVKDIDAPHEIEIEYPNDVAQTTIFSVIEPNRAGKVLPIGLDSGVIITEEDATGIAAGKPETKRHRLVFWPRTKSPLLLVCNHRDDAESIIGSIRVVRRADVRSRPAVNRTGRKIFANLERPLFPENFSAAESLDERSGRSLDDWTTFYDGAVRLVEHLREHSIDGLSLTCLTEGSTLYPSKFAQPTPKHDRGIYFADGRDPVRKDVLEMLFRICDREGVTLVPTLDLATPLPALERQMRNRSRAAGISLVNSQGQTFVEAFGANRGRAPYYNPLDPRVQAAVQALVQELVTRYGRHRSFGGIQLAASPESFTHLPDIQWGMDATTLARFKADTKAPLEDPAKDLFTARSQVLSPRIRPAWAAWRCQQLADFYLRLQNEVSNRSQERKLYLSFANLIDGPVLRRVFQPRLMGTEYIQQGMKNLGFDVALYENHSQTVLVRPRRIESQHRLDRIGTYLEMGLSRELDEQFAASPESAAEFSHNARRVRLRGFDEVSPFGRGNTLALLVAHVSPSDAANRRRFVHSLASRDVTSIFEGGWMLPLGQEAALDPLFHVFRQLPTVPFETFKNESVRTSPLVIRTATQRGRTFIYVVNDSPWNVGAEITTSAPASLPVNSLNQRTVGPLEPQGETSVLPLELKPYDLVAVTLEAADVKILDAIATLPPEVEPSLARTISSIKSRARFLRNPPELKVVTNSSFERTDNDSIPGWYVESPDAVEGQASVVSEGFESQMALRLSNKQQTLSVRSDEFELPASRQLAASLRVRSASAIPPRIKLSIESGDQEYSLWRPILNDRSGQTITREWQEFVFPLKKIPKSVAEKVNIRIDLIGRGDVLIDNLKLYDSMLLRQPEHGALGERIALLDFAFRSQEFGSCFRDLQGYWPRYLIENVPEAPEPTKVPKRQVERSPAKTSRWEKIKKLVPKLSR